MSKYQKYKYPPRIQKIIHKGVNPHDAEILSEIQDNLVWPDIGKSRVPISDFSVDLKEFDKIERKRQLEDGVPYMDQEEWWYEVMHGTYYMKNKNGNVELVWYGVTEGGFPYLKNIPSNLLDLPDLKFLWMFCEVKKELIPDTLKSNDKFEVQMIHIGGHSDWKEIHVDPFVFDLATEYHEIIDLDNFFELKIFKKGEDIQKKKGWSLYDEVMLLYNNMKN